MTGRATRAQEPHTSSVEEVSLLGIAIANMVLEDAVRAVVHRVEEGRGGYVCTPNVDHLVRSVRDPEFRQIVANAWLRLPDGMGVIYGSRIVGTPLRGTVTGRLLPEAIGRALAPKGKPIALIGGRSQADVNRAAARLTERGVLVADAVAPPMGFAVGSREDELLITRLAASRAAVFFVALGSPLQERWMAAHVNELEGRVLVGVGAAVDVLSGRVAAAPPWMTRVGIEWLWRLAHEPRRLTRRYLVDDPIFFIWMLQARWRSGRP